MDQIERDFARFKQPVLAVAGGVAAALVIATLPHVYLEDIVGATGLPEIVPAAAPPLGNTARGLIAVVAGMVSASALYLFLNHKMKSHEGGSDMGLAIGKNLGSESSNQERDGKSRMAAPKLSLSARSLTRFLRKPKKYPGQVTELKDLPDTRLSDRHPDAPARTPIFASSDLGQPLGERIKRVDESIFEKDTTPFPEPAAPFAAPAEAAVADEALQAPLPERERATQNQTETNAPQDQAVVPDADLSNLSLAELASRLEAGLNRLEALQKRERVTPPPASNPALNPAKASPLPEAASDPAPVAIPPLRSVDMSDGSSPEGRQADMDAALKAALGTLERMTVQR